MSPYDVLRSPMITEKSEGIRALQNTLCFRVHPDATKTDVKKAVEKVFRVKVDAVRTVNYAGKLRRQGRSMGYRSHWKKAYVKLKEGEKMVEYAQA